MTPTQTYNFNRDIAIFKECLIENNYSAVGRQYGLSRNRVPQIIDKMTHQMAYFIAAQKMPRPKGWDKESRMKEPAYWTEIADRFCQWKLDRNNITIHSPVDHLGILTSMSVMCFDAGLITVGDVLDHLSKDLIHFVNKTAMPLDKVVVMQRRLRACGFDTALDHHQRKNNSHERTQTNSY